MTTSVQPQGAATPPQTTPPAAPPTRLDTTKARIEKVGAVATVLGGIGAVLVAGIGTASGYVQSTYDWLTSASSTTSQVTAIEERVKAIETFKATVEADRAEAAKTARTLDDAVRELARQGADVASLRDLQRQVEMKLERLDGILEVLRERRR